MQPNQKAWDVTMLSSFLSQADVAKVMRVPLFSSVRTDRRIWKENKNGLYTVKSVYRICMDTILDTSHLKVPGNWNLIWSLKVPPRVKNLLWRLGRNVVPNRWKWQSRGVDCPAQCVFYAEGIETNWHLFFSCTKSVECWERANLWGDIQLVMYQDNDFSEFLFNVMQRLIVEKRQSWAMMLWSIWKSRNIKFWEGIDESAAQLVSQALNVLEEWKSANEAVQQNRQTPVQNDLSWKKPPIGKFKCNVDASFSSNDGRVGIGMCLRDADGCFVLANTLWYHSNLTVDEGEACGLLEAVKWVIDLQLDNLIFELDSKRVVDNVNHIKEDVSNFNAIVNDCRHQLYFLPNSSVEFSRRQANGVAHALARVATCYASSRVFIDIPPCIRPLIDNEIN